MVHGGVVREAEHVGDRARRGARVLIAVACVAFGLAGLLVGRVTFGGHTVWSPLGPYPVQQVGDTVVDGMPTISLSAGTVKVRGTKCVDGTGYDVAGTSSWQSVDPRGTVIRTGTGTRPAADGCTSFSFENTIPASVAAAVRAQTAAGHPNPVWRLAGVERPVDGNRTGAELAWATEPFVLVDD